MQNKRVLVTGASRGIGRAVAVAFAHASARVAVHYHHNQTAAQETLKLMPGEGHRLCQADIASATDCKKLVHDTLNQLGGIDILVNNAGIFEQHPLTEMEYKDWIKIWDQTLAVNLSGVARITYWTVQAMLNQQAGKIINISSRGAFRGEPDAPAYGASKAGLNAFSQSLAQALASHNIIVAVVAPGWVDTDMAQPYLSDKKGASIKAQSPLKRVARPAEIAETVLFLASGKADFITGAIVDVNGASYLRS